MYRRGLPLLLAAMLLLSGCAVGNMPQKTEAQEKPAAERLVKISSVEPNLNQPRRHFDEDALMELSESIKQYGVLQPLLVSDKKDYFEIIAGERRWRAAKMAGLKEVPVVVKEFTDQEIVEISLIENIQREDLNPTWETFPKSSVVVLMYQILV